MTSTETAGSKLVNHRDERVGKIDRVVSEEGGDGPEWAVVRVGLLGLRKVLVPLGDAVERDGTVCVPYETEQIRGCPPIDLEEDRIPAEKADLLHRHFGLEPVLEPSVIADGDDLDLPREPRDAKPPALEEGPDDPLSKRRRERARELGVPGSD